jgi:hypothetical protein
VTGDCVAATIQDDVCSSDPVSRLQLHGYVGSIRILQGDVSQRWTEARGTATSCTAQNCDQVGAKRRVGVGLVLSKEGYSDAFWNVIAELRLVSKPGRWTQAQEGERCDQSRKTN